MNVLRRMLVAGVAVLALGALPGMEAHASHTLKAAHATKTIKTDTSGNKFRFNPKTVTVKVGTRVIWKNVSAAPHTVTSSKGGHFNKQLPTGKSVSITFKKAGTYTYLCTIHPYMHGKIIVKK